MSPAFRRPLIGCVPVACANVLTTPASDNSNPIAST
jgi:hypothetical protein